MTPARLDVAIDEHRRIIRGSLVVESSGDIEIRLPHRLESPNRLLHAHWRTRTKDKQAWRARLLLVMADATGYSSVAGFEHPWEAMTGAYGLEPVRDRRRVHVDRQVPSSRNFVRDRENLVYSVKSLLDQVKYLGFVRDDSMKWIDLDVTQRVSDDGRDWTVIRIEVPAGEPRQFPVSTIGAQPIKE